jgi:iron complex outermembrane recepter protein
MNISRKFWVVVILFLGVIRTYGQADSSSVDLFKLSFEDLMKVKIVSASKEEELFFESPVSSYVITRQDIINNGSTSIPEALRLAPALIVRETANGTYDVSIRGGKDGLPSHRVTSLNMSILAMIDNRPIFNYFSGGTNWLNLPVSIADVERIEIVYGPNSPLYGPNAVDGVINIITRKAPKGHSGTYGTATMLTGENSVFSGIAGSRISDKLEVNVSGNHGKRKRLKREFYDVTSDSFITDLREHSNPVVSASPYAYYPDPDLGSTHTGINFSAYFTPTRRTTFSFVNGYNESSGLSPFSGGVSMNQVSNTNVSNMLKAEVGNITFQTSLLRGSHELMGNISEFNFDYSTWDNYLDYNLKFGKKLSLRPAVSFQNAIIDDRDYTVNAGMKGLFNQRASMVNYAFSLKGDYNPIKSLRIVAAIRNDKFTAPDDSYISYQGIVNYKINSKNIFRFLSGRSFSGSFIEPSFVNLTMVDDEFAKATLLGNKDMKLMQNNILELGYRTQLGKKATLDFSVFQQSYKDFQNLIGSVLQDPVIFPFQRGEFQMKYGNLDLKSVQRGATLSGSLFIGKSSFKGSVTYQETQLYSYSPYSYQPHWMYPEFNTANVTDKQSDYAPDLFGNFSFTMPVRKWTFNLSSYFYTNHRQDGTNSYDPFTGTTVERSIENIDGKVLLNANVIYKVSSRFKVFVNGRNILGQNARESYGTDKIGTLLFAGVHLDF